MTLSIVVAITVTVAFLCRAQHDCPPDPACSARSSQYRTIDGSCNNPTNPWWGQSLRPYLRLVEAHYADGIWEPPVTRSGASLPNARRLSLRLFGETEMGHPRHTIVGMQFGQLVAHDVSFTADAYGLQCCNDGKMVPKAKASRRCLPIEVAHDDPVMSEAGIECLNVVRTKTNLEDPCLPVVGPAEQLSSVTGFLDLSVVYGNSRSESDGLRAFSKGLMKVEHRHGKHWPPSHPNRTRACDVTGHDTEACYLTGDRRANQSPQLALLQIAFLLEHNRLAGELSILNHHWDDERLFQEARHINIGQYQAIVYYEWLPIFLGHANLLQYGVVPSSAVEDFVDDYDPHVDPSIGNAFGAVALRYFHHLIVGHLDLVEESMQPTAAIRLSDWLDRPSVLETAGNYEKLSRGMVTQPHDRPNLHLTPEMKHFLFRHRAPVGLDLKAVDIQRARDHGLASYNKYRQFCGLPVVRHWVEFEEILRPGAANAIRQQYEALDDVELAVAGAMERLHGDGMAGQTFTCLLLEQFRRSRVGDRFFFENGRSSYTVGQVRELRNASMGRILCDNTVGLDMMQMRAFLLVSDTNPVIPCGQLPEVGLSHWRSVEP